jgi:hypothetical protein
MSITIAEALAIEQEAAQRAGALAYMAADLVQASLPHSNQATNEFTRRNGNLVLTILAHSSIGLPYGIIPRLLLAWISTEAVKTRQKTLFLGDSLADFIRKVNLGTATGGKNGSITRLREQMKRLFSASIKCFYEDDKHFRHKNLDIIADSDLWWCPIDPGQIALFKSTITLTHEFFTAIIANPVPVDIRVLGALRSPMAIDIYCWLTHRMSYLSKNAQIPWELLQMQFGADYANTKSGRQGFRRNFNAQMLNVLNFYPEAKVEQCDKGIILKPSKPHIAKIIYLSKEKNPVDK